MDHLTPDPNPALAAPQRWAIVELLGHVRLAGAISEQTFAGATLIRVDVPEVVIVEREFDPMENRWINRPRGTIQAHTRSFGVGALYSIQWVDESTARAMAASLRHKPVSDYVLREAVAQWSAADRLALLEHDAGATPDPL